MFSFFFLWVLGFSGFLFLFHVVLGLLLEAIELNLNGVLQLLETMVKNCGEYIHYHIAERKIVDEMIKIVKKKVWLSSLGYLLLSSYGLTFSICCRQSLVAYLPVCLSLFI